MRDLEICKFGHTLSGITGCCMDCGKKLEKTAVEELEERVAKLEKIVDQISDRTGRFIKCR